MCGIVRNSLVLPIVTREVAIHLEAGSSVNASLDLSNLGFLLGTFPSAPGTLFYAMQYNVAVDLVRSLAYFAYLHICMSVRGVSFTCQDHHFAYLTALLGFR